VLVMGPSLSHGVVLRQPQKGAFSSFFEPAPELLRSPGGNPANDKFGKSDVRAALARA